ncbi:DUF2812 domain-containing protein [Streptococcus parauberis]|uniref:DUF2812 domain-containing protein n=2 Tax=Streptococcus parauberis TaxID=1348 RepID=A0AAE4HYJ4_9STRE|nr:DUF2812 domain-containing protein [Streptococcus parauberis]MDT2731812.1 DUF2812 domain-containing protein [Streptococcus parauberis]PIO78386.1 hypothetical protein ADO05_01717 [Streptococcus parauberis]POS67956.1 hypothetical protein AOS90_00646 [Streptococcus parauberis]RFE02467.1 hypothetical protein ADO06_00735 [Streptococcus parauberis]
MTETKKIIKIFTIADYMEEEAWLRQQSQKGWKFVKNTNPITYLFEKSKAEDVIYQLEYKNEAVTRDYLQLYQDYGWEYCGTYIGWNYFRKAAKLVEHAGENQIFSDRESKLNMISHIIKTRMLPLLIIFLCIIIPNLSKTDYLSGDLLDKIIFGIFMFLFVLYIVLITYCGGKLIHLRKNL